MQNLNDVTKNFPIFKFPAAGYEHKFYVGKSNERKQALGDWVAQNFAKNCFHKISL